MARTMRITGQSGLVAFSIALAACAPQSTHIMTEIHRPDGTIERYTNLSQGYGYNPNITGNVNIGGVSGTTATPTIIDAGATTPWYPWVPAPMPWYGPWNCGPFTFVTPPVCTPGAAPIPVNMDVYGWAPGIR